MDRIHLLIAVLISAFSATAQDKFITVGSGGGFAGTVTRYKITPAGEVFRGKGLGEIKYTECGKMKKAAVKKWIASVEEKTTATFNHPGNLYYFITYTEKGREQTITWGAADHPVPDEIKKLYEEINSRVHAIRYKPVK